MGLRSTATVSEPQDGSVVGAASRFALKRNKKMHFSEFLLSVYTTKLWHLFFVVLAHPSPC